MNICVLTIYTENIRNIADITAFNNFKSYCKINNYNLKVINLDDSYVELERPAAWYKIKETERLLKSGEFDWVFFIDVDCLFMNPLIKLEEFIDDNSFLIIPSNNDVFETPIKNKFGSNGVVSCQYLIKNTTKSLEFLEDVWRAEDITLEAIHKHDWEQRQFKYSVAKPNFCDDIKIVDEKLFNRYWYTSNVFLNFTYNNANKNIWEVGDFIVHIPGYHREERYRTLYELNMLSGGPVAKFERDGTKITFSPSLNMYDITLRVYVNDCEILYYHFDELNYKLQYYIIVDSVDDIIIKTFNNKGDILGIKEL